MTFHAEWNGRQLARAYYDEVVRPLLMSRWPELPHAAGRLGNGSDVLGLDDETSRDHDWGLRLSLFVDPIVKDDVFGYLDEALPGTFLGLPTRFAFTGQDVAVHHVEVDTVTDFVTSRLGFDPLSGADETDWLSLTGQTVLEVTGGPVFADTTGDLGRVRSALEWYPDDLWRYLLACDWLRIEEELPLLGRAGDRGDDLGSRLIAGRLADIAIHLAFLIGRRWMPYSKWKGTLFRTLRCADDVGPLLVATLDAKDWRSRQDALSKAFDHLFDAQRQAGLPAPAPATLPFWDRPYRQPNEDIAAALLESIASPAVQALPRGRGSVEQRTDNVALLVNRDARRRMVR